MGYKLSLVQVQYTLTAHAMSGLVRVYTKPQGQQPDFSDPVVLSTMILWWAHGGWKIYRYIGSVLQTLLLLIKRLPPKVGYAMLKKTLGSYTTFISSVKIPQQAIGATIKHHICQTNGSNVIMGVPLIHHL
ncbi:uncharacterized protein LOC131248528 isoform X4 [Magnolia sinica]|uniref:uncharacterized protein LOC131248528 isoform X4 n=1 Tax=Magnolia sinica TaxID=86752 RepID=UPI0026596939|nr:uncharacterized protein LOC131248528 isoform X4 [Magnolia sinica]